MSVWKGSNLIAMSVPGQNGTNGTDGRNGDGIMIVPNFTELHNNINANGQIEITNQVLPAEGQSEPPSAAWCEVGGYDNAIVGTGQATMVWGYGNTVTDGQCGVVFGYQNDINSIGQGTLISGYENRLTNGHQGTTLIGYSNAINDNNMKPGMLIQGYGHTKLYVSQNGGVQLGYGLNDSATTLKPSMPKNNGTDSQVAMVVGVRLGGEGASSQHAIGLAVRGDGDVGVYGDIGFTAKTLDNGSAIGRYTLGAIVAKVNEIAQSLGLQPIPTNGNSLN